MQPCRKGAGSVVGGLEKLMDIEKNITFVSENVFAECESYTWKTDRNDGKEINVPIDKHNHATDCIRYVYNDYLHHLGRAIATV